MFRACVEACVWGLRLQLHASYAEACFYHFLFSRYLALTESHFLSDILVTFPDLSNLYSCETASKTSFRHMCVGGFSGLTFLHHSLVQRLFLSKNKPYYQIGYWSPPSKPQPSNFFCPPPPGTEKPSSGRRKVLIQSLKNLKLVSAIFINFLFFHQVIDLEKWPWETMKNDFILS